MGMDVIFPLKYLPYLLSQIPRDIDLSLAPRPPRESLDGPSDSEFVRDFIPNEGHSTSCIETSLVLTNLFRGVACSR